MKKSAGWLIVRASTTHASRVSANSRVLGMKTMVASTSWTLGYDLLNAYFNRAVFNYII